MPRWRPLPEELDPQIREFTSQLRRLVDRSGMSVASIADRTGYSKSSWERYLGGRLLPPRGAAHALAKVTDTDIRHIETMWELAERAWSRAEMRHDVTMEAIRVAQAREALGEFWDEPAKGRKRGRNKDKEKGRDKGLEKSRESDGAHEADDVEVNRAEEQSASGSLAPPSASALYGGGSAAGSTDAGPRPMDDETAVLRARPLPGKGPDKVVRNTQQLVDVASWGATPRNSAAAPAGNRPPMTEGAPGGTSGVEGRPLAVHPSGPPKHPGAYPGSPSEAHDAQDGQDGSGDKGRSSRGSRIAALLGGAVAMSVLLGIGVLVFGLPGTSEDSSAAPAPPPASRQQRDLPAGVKCRGSDCTGKDPEKMGCGGQNVKSSNSAFVGPSMVEVRYSEVCKAAWGRITGAAQGDGLKISAGGEVESDEVDSTNDAYTEMVAVGSATEARACATLVAGTTGCTEVGASEASAPASPAASSTGPATGAGEVP
ncbi:helix-turn-helix domain-containing protein [Streptomyces albidus (ex Kaewkla and Franco 2022)]|uniref:helix-turn-helix domain-containing protein n=1 Tax=Streptomyces albidus (ex Kaewkla and Franco 2022) TaxID=722709 RepID=UPI0015EF4BC1|nr:DUF2690 domain-containing protein [Streptomyces albidus (ex Kaewkla and Franco 2022)]